MPRLYVAFEPLTSTSRSEHDLPGEAAVVDLHLLVDAVGAARPAALAGDDQRALVGEDLDLGRVDARELDDDVERGGLLGAVAVDLRPEASPAAREARDLPETVEQLVHLARGDDRSGHEPWARW